MRLVPYLWALFMFVVALTVLIVFLAVIGQVL